MAKKEPGLMDTLVEGFARSLALKGAVEASRDEYGKVDKWKATGIAMGLGRTSFEDVAQLGAILGAEGAFDDIPDDPDVFLPTGEDRSAPVTAPPAPAKAPRIVDEKSYELEKETILVTGRVFIWGSGVLALLALIGLMCSAIHGLAALALLCTAGLVFFGMIVYVCFDWKKQSLIKLETEFAEFKQRQEKKNP